MSYYNYNNTSVVLGSGNESHHFSVASVGISLQNNLVPLYIIPDKSSFDYKSTQGLNGSLDLTYYLTGQDFLANFIENEKNFVSGNFAGLTFSSGYLTSYSFAVQQYGPVTVSANINFYGGLQGTFTPTHETSAVTGARPLNYSDAGLTGISGAIPQFGGILQNAESVDYNFSSEFTPVYVVGEQMPREIRFNQKTINLNINGYNLDFYTHENFASGLYDAEMTIGFKKPGMSSPEQEYKTRGTLTSQSIEVSAGEKLRTSISLIQNKIGNAPSIVNVTPAKGARGSEVTIEGNYITNATSVSFGDSKIQAVDFVEVDPVNNTIKVNVPNDAIDSYITVRTPGGNDTHTAAVFNVIDDGF